MVQLKTMIAWLVADGTGQDLMEYAMLAGLIAIVPARLAARTAPADALRAE